MGWRGQSAVARETKRKMTLRKNNFFVIEIEKYIEDIKQDEKHVSGPLESIMRPTDPVKEELRPIVFKMNQVR